MLSSRKAMVVLSLILIAIIVGLVINYENNQSRFRQRALFEGKKAVINLSEMKIQDDSDSSEVKNISVK